MATATERAEARRKAILARRGDRLAKLTSSARGEDAPAYMHDDPPLAPLPRTNNLERFVGEESSLPTPHGARTASPSPFANFGMPATGADPSIWSEEQQSRLLNALMAGAAQSQTRSAAQTPLPPALDGGGAPLPEGDPLAALMAMMGPQGENGDVPNPFGQGMMPQNLFGPPPPAAPAERTLLQKLMPIVHLIAGWTLLAYFVIWKEPAAYNSKPHLTNDGGWRRWAELGWERPKDGWGVQFVPFFWAFTTLTLILHTWRVFKGLDPVRPHMLVSLALPHLPPPIPSVVLNGMKYWQIGTIFLDDIAVLLFGIGFIIWICSWFVN
ncbi:hypothetical protein BDW22DRAFT_1406601 [Trametopsis cervina]|nr:hypothetical protein BDW22DRAFT_1406601 [Trametopsis cervina]